MATSLLVGNGINRLNNAGISWEDILRQLSPGHPRGLEFEYLKHKPFALLYEEAVLSRATQSLANDEFAVKKQISALVERMDPDAFHRRLMCVGARHILTTNYDYNLERAAASKFPRSNLQSETKYSAHSLGHPPTFRPRQRLDSATTRTPTDSRSDCGTCTTFYESAGVPGSMRPGSMGRGGPLR